MIKKKKMKKMNMTAFCKHIFKWHSQTCTKNAFITEKKNRQKINDGKQIKVKIPAILLFSF